MSQEELNRSKRKRRHAERSVTKKQVQKIITLIKRKGYKIKKRLNELLEGSLFKSYNIQSNLLGGLNYTQEKKDFPSRLEEYLNNMSEIEQNVCYYFMDDETFERLPKNIREKG